jgi:protoporphyrinogen oxidase
MPGASRVAIVGSGMLGMALADRFTKAGHRVTIFEAGPAPGGLASADPIGPFVWDRFYHVILSSDRHLLELIDQLGLTDRLRWHPSRTGFFIDGRLLPLTTAFDFLRFPPIGLVGKARLAATILRAARIRDGSRLEDIPVTTWLERWSGRRVFERLWQPLLQAKLGDGYQSASAAFIWAIIARMYAARRAGLKQELFGYVEGGYATILDRLTRSLLDRGVDVRQSEPVRQVIDTGDGAQLATADGDVESFDRVVLTVPCPEVVNLCPQLGDGERARLNAVSYQGVVCVSTLLRRPLGGYYITNLADSRLSITAGIEMTALVDRAGVDGMSLVYLPWYLPADDPRWSWTDEAFVAECHRSLAIIYPDMREEDVVSVRVARARRVLAISTLGYSRDCLPATRTSLPHVDVVNSAQIVNGTLNVNETLALAAAKAPEVLAALRSSPVPAGATR